MKNKVIIFIVIFIYIFTFSQEILEMKYEVKLFKGNVDLGEDFYISQNEFNKIYYDYLKSYPQEFNILNILDFKMNILNKISDKIFVKYYAYNEGFVIDENQTYDELFKRVYDNISYIPQWEMDEYLTTNFNKLRLKYEYAEIEEILVNNLEQANLIFNYIDGDIMNFDTAAMLYSDDLTGIYNTNHHEFINWNSCDDNIEKAVFTSPLNKVIGPIKSNLGYHIIFIYDRKTFKSIEDIYAAPRVIEDISRRYGYEKFRDWLWNFKSEKGLRVVYESDEMSKYSKLLRITDHSTRVENEIIKPVYDKIFDDSVKMIVSVDKPNIDSLVLFMNSTNNLKVKYNKQRIEILKYLNLKYPESTSIMDSLYDEAKEESEIKIQYSEYLKRKLQKLTSIFNQKSILYAYRDIIQRSVYDLKYIIENKLYMADSYETIVLNGLYLSSFLSNNGIQEFFQNLRVQNNK